MNLFKLNIIYLYFIYRKMNKDFENFLISYNNLKAKCKLLTNNYLHLQKLYKNLENNITLNNKYLELKKQNEELININNKLTNDCNEFQKFINNYNEIINKFLNSHCINENNYNYYYIEKLINDFKNLQEDIKNKEDNDKTEALINLFDENK